MQGAQYINKDNCCTPKAVYHCHVKPILVEGNCVPPMQFLKLGHVLTSHDDPNPAHCLST